MNNLIRRPKILLNRISDWRCCRRRVSSFNTAWRAWSRTFISYSDCVRRLTADPTSKTRASSTNIIVSIVAFKKKLTLTRHRVISILVFYVQSITITRSIISCIQIWASTCSNWCFANTITIKFVDIRTPRLCCE